MVSHMPNIRYFSGFSGTLGSLLLTKKHGFLFIDSRYHLAAKAILPSWIALVDVTKGFEKPWQKILKRFRIRKLGFEGFYTSHRNFLRLRKISGKTVLKDVSEQLSALRMQKTIEELRLIIKAQQITDKIFEILRKGGLKSSMSEKMIAWKIETIAHDLSADDISFPPIVGINEHSASPHHKNTDRKLKKGDLVLLDFGVIYHGYCSDMTRVLFSRQPQLFEQKIYSLVLEAQETTERSLRSDMKGHKVDAIARKIITEKGYSKHFSHSLGHGVGLEIHELPNLSEKYKKAIPENAVITVEPGIYLPGKFGVRLEDMGIVKKDGFRVLTESPKDLHEVRIRI